MSNTELLTYESVIEDAQGAIGLSLGVIRDKELWRQAENPHTSFNEYCKERWGYTAQHANQLIRAQKFFLMLEDSPIQPVNEYQVRHLSGLQPHEAVMVWSLAVATCGGRMTGNHVKHCREVYQEVKNTGTITIEGIAYKSDTDTIPVEFITPEIVQTAYEATMRQKEHIKRSQRATLISEFDLGDQWYHDLNQVRATGGHVREYEDKLVVTLYK